MKKIYTFFCSMVLLLAFGQLSAADFDVVNTGSNMTVFVTPGTSMTGDLSNINQIGIFYTNDSGDLACAGVSSFDAAGNFQITVWGSEAGADNGMADGEEMIWLAEANNGFTYNVSAAFQADAMANYTLNSISFVSALDFVLDDSSVVEGCMDGHYLEYNADANVHDPSQCLTWKVDGCTDEGYEEYNPAANFDDGSCATEVTACDATVITMGGGSWISETSFVIADCDGNELVSGAGEEAEYCVALTENYSITMNDSYGDGWNGNILNIAGTEYTLDGAEETVVVGSCGDVAVPGCTDETASNYNADATEDDGSCEYPVVCDATELTVNMVDAYGDGWNGNVLTIGDATATLETGAEGTATLCVDLSSCTAITVGGGSWGSEVSWSIPELELEGGAPYEGMIGDCVTGCGDETAENYNADADIVDDSTCEYALVQGCTDAAACNYDEAAEEDNGSCEYAAEGFDCEGNCVAGVAMSFGGGSWISETSFTISDCDGNEILSAGGVESAGCVELPENYTITMNDSYGDGWNGNVLTIGDAEYTLDGAEATVVVGSCGVAGCIDADACNFSADATFDDGSCTYAEAGLDCDGNCLSGDALTVNMYDAYGDGWNGNTLTVGGSSVTLESGAEGTATVCVDLSVCNAIEVGGGSWGSEVSWSIGDLEGTVGSYEIGDCYVAVPGCTDESADNYNAEANEDDGSCTYTVYGCLDANATNYDAAATDQAMDQYGNLVCVYASCDDIPDAEGCIYADGYSPYNEWFSPENCTTYGGTACVEAPLDTEGCLDANADNYNAEATVQGYDQWGNIACNYSSCDDIPDAEGCMYAENYSAFNADFTADNCVQYGGTACVEAPLDTEGCLDANASNYNADATVQGYDQWGNLQCIYASCDDIPEYGCIYADGFGAFNAEFGAAACSSYGGTPCEEPSDDVVGCMDANASNYNADATVQGYDQWGNLQCIYASCDDVPEYGCIYADGFGAFNAEFGADACISYGGTPCEEAPICDATELTVNMVDAYGDGWNGNVLTIGDATATLESGAEGTATLCVDLSSCTAITVGGGSWGSEVSWSIPELELEGGAPYEGMIGDCVTGCGDETAENYNADADIVDDSTCEYALVQGCTDAAACNYDEAAEEDNGSCEYAAEGFDCEGNCVAGVAMSFGGGSWISETSFTISDCDGNEILSAGGVESAGCVELPENYTITMNDSYGDGWNGNVLTIGDAEYTLDGAEATVVVGSCGVAGCIDADACNFSADATFDDGSCTYAEAGLDCDGNCLSGDALTVNMYDAYGDGWNGNTLTVGGSSVTLESGAEGTATVCVDLSVCNAIEVGGGSWGSEVSWSIGDLEGTVGSYEIGTCAVFGCTNESACNFNADATADDGSCEYAADGFDCDGNSTGEPCAAIDFSYTNTGVNMTLLIAGGSNLPDGSTIGAFVGDLCVGSGNLSGGALQIAVWGDDSSTEEVDGASDGDVISLVAQNESGVYETSTEFGYVLNGIEVIESITFNYECTGTAESGCMDPEAFNYNANAVVDDGSCIAVVEGCMDGHYLEYNADANVHDPSQCYTWKVDGCTDEAYLEYNSDANVDDGSCENLIPTCDATELTVNMVDAYGDGWNGNVLAIGDATATLESGSEGTATLCVDLSSCTAITVGGGSWGSEVSWSIPELELEGGAPYEGMIGDCVTGCGDETAENYNADADIVDDSTCEYALVQGCTDAAACNYDEAAEEDNGSCEYAAEGLDCEGNCVAGVAMTLGGGSWISETSFTITGCDGSVVFEGGGSELSTCIELPEGYTISMTDAYGDGWNGNVLTIGEATYTIETGAEATVDMGCAVLGCTDDTATNYNAEATEDDGSCEYALVQGCTDATACNYDEAAEEDNGSCEYAAEGFDCEGNCVAGVAMSFGGGSWISETSFTISDCDGNEILSAGGVESAGCVELPENYTITMNDSYGDGWNGNVLTIGDAEYTLDGAEATVVVGSCGVAGCIDADACNFSADATFDDGSCTYAEAGLDCDGNCLSGDALTVNMYDAYGDGWNGNTLTVGGSSVTLESGAEGTATVCVDLSVCNAIEVGGGSWGSEVSWSIGDLEGTVGSYEIGSCAVLGCTDEAADNYNAEANEDDGSCTYTIYGCMDETASNYNADANTDNGSCTYDVFGCTDVNADNFNSDANVDDGSCGYADAFADAQAALEVATANAEAAAEVAAEAAAAAQADLDAANAATAEAQAAVDAANAAAAEAAAAAQADLDAANTAAAEAAAEAAAAAQADLDAANAATAEAQTALDAANDALAAAAANVADLEAQLETALANQEDGISQADVDAVQADLDAANDALAAALANVADLEAQLADALANPADDGVSQADVDAVQADLDAANADLATALGNVADLEAQLEAALANQEDGVSQADVDAAYADGAASVTPEDGIGQADVDAAADAAYADGAASVTPEDGIGQADVDAAYADGAASVTPEDGIGQADVDAAYADGAASVTPEDGIGQADVDAAYADGAASVTPEDGIGQADVDAAYADGAASVTPEDGVSQADVDAAVAAADASSSAIIADLQAQLDEGGPAEPIFIDIVNGWNILGYTLPYGQDVAATVADIVADILIVKNNAAQVYWPEFEFNGIGDFVPGQGYQIKTTAAISGYTWPDVDGQRIEMNPTVPAWAIDMEADIHPNDIRTLVKVVNMLGQEVNVADQFSGEVLLYLYNDGSVEKKIVR